MSVERTYFFLHKGQAKPGTPVQAKSISEAKSMYAALALPDWYMLYTERDTNKIANRVELLNKSIYG